MNMPKETLWLENQVCFPLYAVSRMVTQLYTPMLKELDITYPQYLVLLVLWKESPRSVSEISHLLFLESNTLTPLLKRLEQKGLIKRQRSTEDERRVDINLTAKGQALHEKALCIPQQIIDSMHNESISETEIVELKSTLNKLMDLFSNKAATQSS